MRKSFVILMATLAIAACASASPVVGGVSSAGAEDPDVQAAAKFVLASANSNDCHGKCVGLRRDGELKSVEVKSVTQQVVAGVLYRMELLVTDANHKKSTVYATVWSRPWLAAKNNPAEPATQITELKFEHLDGSDA